MKIRPHQYVLTGIIEQMEAFVPKNENSEKQFLFSNFAVNEYKLSFKEERVSLKKQLLKYTPEEAGCHVNSLVSLQVRFNKAFEKNKMMYLQYCNNL